MELLCPHCFKKVAVPDERAGQVVTCPLCAQAFGAPALSPQVVVSAPAPLPHNNEPVQVVARDTYGVVLPPPPLPPSPPTSITERAPSRPVSPEPEPPPPPPGEYTHSYVVHLRDDVLAWLTPACLTAIFVLSFFPWHTLPASLWQLAFTERGSNLFLAYTLLTLFLAWPLSVAALLFDRQLVPVPPALRPWFGMKVPLLGAILAVGVLLLGFDYLHQHFYEFENRLAIVMKLAARLHALALLCCLLEFWLQQRRRRNLPLPRIEMRW